MYWEKIQNWGSFDPLYKKMTEKFNHGATFVEIGVWLGSSTVCMAENIENSKKFIEFYAIDPFDGVGESYEPYKEAKEKTLFESYTKNIEPVKKYIHTLKGYSYEFPDMFDEKSIDFIFIDGDHSYDGIKRDLNDWFPKIKDGGVMAGHDYNSDLKIVVDGFFGDRQIPIQVVNNGCWYIEK